MEKTKTLDDLQKAIDTKLQLLKFTHEQTPKAIEKANVTSLERKRKTLTSKVEEVHDLKVRTQELRIETGDKEDDILDWSVKLEECVTVFEKGISDLDEAIKELKKAELRAAKQEEESVAAQIRGQKYEEEMQYEKAKLEQRLKYEKKIEENRKDLKDQKDQGKEPHCISAELPKLVITKFKGTHADWLRFWNQFEAEIDAANVPQITNFSYLKELLEPKVRAAIDGLPYTTEGYERAKNILKTKYGKTSEITNAYVTSIMSLPIVHGATPNRIREFYEKLLSSVQSLENYG